MKKNTAVIVAAVSALVALIALFFVFRGAGSPQQDSGSGDASVVLYYGTECPHCKDVEAFIDENGIEGKVSFLRKEVWHDRANAAEMLSRAESCGIGRDQAGVPFLFADGQCYVGTPDVEGYFREKAGIPESAE